MRVKILVKMKWPARKKGEKARVGKDEGAAGRAGGECLRERERGKRVTGKRGIYCWKTKTSLLAR